MVNYSKSYIYKICCKDPSIIDEYIGSTINHYRRKQEHRSYCNNENSKKYNSFVYQFIRKNGGWDNFDMIIIEEYSCESRTQLHQRERHWIEKRKPTLNKNIPSRSIEEYEQTEKCRKYRKKYQQSYYQIKKLKNISAIKIQNFFKKYFNNQIL